MSILGNRVLRLEDPRLLTAGGEYAADLTDLRLAGAVRATYVRSTVAHAEILGIDVDERRAGRGGGGGVCGRGRPPAAAARLLGARIAPPLPGGRPGAVRGRTGRGGADRAA